MGRHVRSEACFGKTRGSVGWRWPCMVVVLRPGLGMAVVRAVEGKDPVFGFLQRLPLCYI